MARRKPCDFIKSAQNAMDVADSMTGEEWEIMERRLENLMHTTKERMVEIRKEREREHWKRMTELQDQVLTLELNNKDMFKTIQQLRDENRLLQR